MGNNLHQKERKVSINYQTLEEVTPKSHLAMMLYISKSTVTRYHRLASIVSPEYREEANIHRFLTRYMCWVLWHINYKHAELRSRKAAEVAIAKGAEALTKSEFERQQRQQKRNQANDISLIGA